MTQIIKEMQDLNSSIEKSLGVVNKNLEWSKTIPFLSVKTEKNKDVLETYKNFTDTDHLARLVWDNNFKIIYANNNFLLRLGYTLDDVIGKYIITPDGKSDFITDDTIEDSISVVQNNMRHGVQMISGVINKWIAKDGSEISCEWLIGFNDTSKGLGTTQCLFLM